MLMMYELNFYIFKKKFFFLFSLKQDTNVQLITDTEADFDASRTITVNQNDDGRQLTSAYLSNRLSTQCKF